MSVDRPLGSLRSEPSDGPLALSDEPGLLPGCWEVVRQAQPLRASCTVQSSVSEGVRGNSFQTLKAACPLCGLPALSPSLLQTLVLASRCFSPGPEAHRQETVWFSLIAAFGLSSEFLECSLPESVQSLL